MKFVDFAHEFPSFTDPRFHFVLQDENDDVIETTERAHYTTALGFEVQLEKSRLNKVDLEVILRMDLATVHADADNEGALAIPLTFLSLNASAGAWRISVDPQTHTVTLLQNLLAEELPARAVLFDVTQFMLTGCIRLNALMQIRASLAQQGMAIAVLAPDRYVNPSLKREAAYAVGRIASYTAFLSDAGAPALDGWPHLKDIASSLIAKAHIDAMSAGDLFGEEALPSLTQALVQYDYPDHFAFDSHQPF